MEKNIRNKGGFSIIEIIVGLALMFFAFIAIVAVFPRMTGHRKELKEVDIANIIAAQELENIQQWSKGLFNDSGGPIPFHFPVDSTGSTISPVYRREGTTYRVRYRGPFNFPNNVNMFAVEVIVEWTTSGKPGSVSLTGAIVR